METLVDPTSGFASSSTSNRYDELAGPKSSTMAPPIGEDRLWSYIDDYGRMQGPFPERLMRQWTTDGYFQGETLVRCVTPPVGVDLQAGLMADQTCMFFPLFVLFADPDQAFIGQTAWVDSYNHEAKYQLIVKMATEMGMDSSDAVQKASEMKRNELPPELPILLDLMGVRSIDEARNGDAVESDPGDEQAASVNPGGSSNEVPVPPLDATSINAEVAAAIAAAQDDDDLPPGEDEYPDENEDDAELQEVLHRSVGDRGAAEPEHDEELMLALAASREDHTNTQMQQIDSDMEAALKASLADPGLSQSG